MPDSVLAAGAGKDLEKIAEYTLSRWVIEQARRYGSILTRHFDSLANLDVRARPFFEDWPELQVSRCEHHYVFSLLRANSPVAILAVFHESMDLPSRLLERLDDESRRVEGESRPRLPHHSRCWGLALSLSPLSSPPEDSSGPAEPPSSE